MFGGNFKLDGDLGKAANTAQKGYHTHQLNQNLRSGNYADAAQNAQQAYQLEQENPTPNGGLTSVAQAYAYDQYAPNQSANSYQAAGSLQTNLQSGNYSNAAQNAQSLYSDGNDYYDHGYGESHAEPAINSKPKNIGWSDMTNLAGNLGGKSAPPPPPPKNDLASLAGNFLGGNQQQQPAPQQSGFESAFSGFLGGNQQPAPQPQQQGFGGAIGSFLGGNQQPAPQPQQQGFGALGSLIGGGQQQQPQEQGWGAAANLFGGQGGNNANNAATGASALNTISTLAGGSQNLPKDVQNTQASLNFYDNYNKGNYLDAGKNAHLLWENHQAGGDGANTNPITQMSNQWQNVASGQGQGGAGGFNYSAVVNPLLSKLGGGFGSKAKAAPEQQLSFGGPKNIASGHATANAHANVQAGHDDQYYDYSNSQPNQQDQYYSYDEPQQQNDQGYYYANDDSHAQENSGYQNHGGNQQYSTNQHSEPDYYTYDSTQNDPQSNQSYYRNDQAPANNQNYYDYNTRRS